MLSSTWNSKGANDKVGANNGRAKIDRFTVDTDNARLVGRVTADLRQSLRTFTFVHLSLRDAAGHDHRFMGPDYLRAVPQTDRLLGQILATISARPALRAHTMVIVTADHGGDGSRTPRPASSRTTACPSWCGVPGSPPVATCTPSATATAPGLEAQQLQRPAADPQR